MQKVAAIVIVRKRLICHAINEEYKFAIYNDRKEISIRNILMLYMHVSFENISIIKSKTIEFIKDKENRWTENLNFPMLWDIPDTLPLMEDKLNIFTSSSKLGGEDIPKDITILGSNMTESREM